MLGLWSACASVGNIIGALMVSQVLHFGYDVSGNAISTLNTRASLWEWTDFQASGKLLCHFHFHSFSIGANS